MEQIRDWAPAYLGDVFDEVQRGRRIVSADHVAGDTALVSSMGSCNGITGFVGNTEGVRIFADCLTIANGGASAGQCYYQPFSFVASDHVTHCKRSGLDMDGYHTLAVCMTNAMVGKFSFSHELKDDRLPRERVMLPVTDDGEPDWEYMSSSSKTMRETLLDRYRRYAEKCVSQLEYASIPSLDEVEWDMFAFADVFDIKKGFYNKKPKHETGGVVPFLGATAKNNGVTEWYSMQNIERSSKMGHGSNEPMSRKIFAGGCVAVTNNGSVGRAYYWPTDFTCSHDINPLYHKDGTSISKPLAMFLICAIEMQAVCFEYARKWRPERMIKSKLMLPKSESGEPDWAYMEQYGTNMMLRKYKQYLSYLNANATCCVVENDGEEHG